MIHLMDRILTLDPLYLHSMFPYERFLAALKAYVGSVEGLCAELCSPRGLYYGRLHNIRSGRVLHGLRKRWKTDRLAHTTT
jgi:hypothetical protein